jgi:hypothetical protein
MMKGVMKYVWLAAGLLVGVVGTSVYYGPIRVAEASGDCRHEDYILCTGKIGIFNGEPKDGVWLLDYRSGKLLATMVDHKTGKIFGFAEMDLVSEFGLKPKQDVHFMMTTGAIKNGQDALYLVEKSTGKLGVYTMGPNAGPTTGVAIRRHDMVYFRQPDAK